MIDLHCHLLPGIDDGPVTLDEALALARTAVANGIRKSVVTPHIQPGMYDNERENIAVSVESFRKAVNEAGIPLEIGMAAEVRIGAEILGMVAEERIPYLGSWQGQKVLLLELPHSHIPPGSDKLVKWLLDRGIRPMIAHPERNKDIIRDFNRIAPFVQLGCLFQITAGSVAGDFGPYARERAEQFLHNGWVTILASDAHNLGARPPRLDHGRDAAARIVGEEAAWGMVREVPEKIIEAT